MPGKKYSKKGVKKAYKKRGYKKRGQKTTTVNVSLNPIPARYITKLKYSDVATTSVGNPLWRFNLNSLYDPNRTGTGHQPYGFDQLAGLYNRYRVIACSYTISCSSTSNPIRYGTIVSNEALTFLTMSEFVENPRARFVTQNPGGNLRQIHGKCYIPSLMGRNKTQYMADDRYQALTTADPAELAILHVQAGQMNDALAPVDLTIVMEFTVEFFDLKNQTQS